MQRGDLACLRSLGESVTPRTPRTPLARPPHRRGHESRRSRARRGLVPSPSRLTSGVLGTRRARSSLRDRVPHGMFFGTVLGKRGCQLLFCFSLGFHGGHASPHTSCSGGFGLHPVASSWLTCCYCSFYVESPSPASSLANSYHLHVGLVPTISRV